MRRQTGRGSRPKALVWVERSRSRIRLNRPEYATPQPAVPVQEIQDFLLKAAKHRTRMPRHLISDHGKQFGPSFTEWCKRKKIGHRRGAVGQSGSIAVIERFMRSLKNECTRQIVVPLSIDDMRTEITLYVTWYAPFHTTNPLSAASRTARSTRPSAIDR